MGLFEKKFKTFFWPINVKMSETHGKIKISEQKVRKKEQVLRTICLILRVIQPRVFFTNVNQTHKLKMW